MAVMCVIKHSGNWEIWRHINVYILGSVRMAVMCVIKLSVTEGVWRYIYVYILGSVHIAVMCVIKHSVTEGIWRYINRCILGSVHIAVLAAVRHSVANCIWINIFYSIVISNHNPMICVSHSFWCIIWGIITYRSCDLHFCGILKKCSFVHWYNFTLGEKACMSSRARIFWKFTVFVYCRYLEMMHIGVCKYLLTPLIILLGCGNWIHNCICPGSGCLILQTLQKLSAWNSEMEVWG